MSWFDTWNSIPPDHAKARNFNCRTSVKGIASGETGENT